MSNFQVVTESTLGTTTQVTPGHTGPVDLSQEHLLRKVKRMPSVGKIKAKLAGLLLLKPPSRQQQKQQGPAGNPSGKVRRAVAAELFCERRHS